MDSITVIALSGMMGSGKDTAAKFLGQLTETRPMSFAAPLKKLASLTYEAKTGSKMAMHEIYSLLVDIFGGIASAPSFFETAVLMNRIMDVADETHLVECIKNNGKPREFLQIVGTNVVREMRENAWADYMATSILRNAAKSIEQYREDCDMYLAAPMGKEPEAPKLTYVITDMRFPNEIDSIRRLPEMVSGRLNLPCSVWCVKLDLPVDVAVSRVSNRDHLDPDVVRASLNHASEQKLDEDLFDVVVDATQTPMVIAQKLNRIVNGSFVKGEGVERDVVEPAVIEHPAMGKVIDLASLRQ